ncbi:MAG: hypothetical protein H6Q69_866 [Firmicutes bacterium]|nr:hypothetical protein [Bacillota bacterium]
MIVINIDSSNKNIIKASVWSFAAEIAAKTVSPLVFLVMTRLLSPEDFGVVAIATTVIGLVNIVNDLGISKIIIHDDSDEIRRCRLNNVAFWFNLIFGIILNAVVIFYADEIAILYGNVEAKNIIIAMSMQIILFSISSVQNANKRKTLEFKSLFFIRFIATCLPALISIPFAFMGFGIWALISGQIANSLANTSMLWLTSGWRPSLSFDFNLLRSVLSKSIWSTLESLIVYVPVVLDTYLITKNISFHALGLYSTSRSLFTVVSSLCFAPIFPVLFSALSLIRNDCLRFKQSILVAQKLVFTASIIIGTGVFVFRKPIELLVFNIKWQGVSEVFGIIFLMLSLENFSSVLVEGYRAKGKFRLLALNQGIYVVITIPLLYYAASYGLMTYVWIRILSLFLLYPCYLIYSKKNFLITVNEYLINTRNVWLFMAAVVIASITIEYLKLDTAIEYTSKLIAYTILLLGFMSVERAKIIYLRNLICKKVNI